VTVWAIVVAAGRGSRFGAPKQFEQLEGRRVVDWAVAACRSVADRVVLVVPDDHLDDEPFGTDRVVAGGATRSASVRCGLDVVGPDADVIVVHDAARPFAAPGLFAAVVTAVRDGADGAVPGVAVADTIKRVVGGQVVATLDRGELVAVQTPQAFAVAALRRAHDDGGDATDDAALVEAAGGRVVVVPGDPANTKITLRTDLA
jgi:2-C-methyl-D-erythritol 4-phosphate cytidylyltransferase